MQKRRNPGTQEVYNERAKIKQGKYENRLIKTLSYKGLINYRNEMDLVTYSGDKMESEDGSGIGSERALILVLIEV